MKVLSLALALAAPAHAALRFGCSTLTVQRLDPVVEPGVVGTSHLHHIIGGNAFNATMEGDIGEKGSCTTCTFSEDFSNYWTAVLYLKAANGSYKRVKIYQNTALPNGINGGMTVYYTQRDFQGNGNVKITSFKPGFRMIIGSPSATKTAAPGLKWVCLQDKGTRFPELNEIPQRACPAGIMSVHHFPACWDGKNLDSPDHASHMYNTVKEAFQNAGACPSSHPVRVAQVAYETLYDTRDLNAEIAKGGKWVLSTGDTAGFATHADYLFGWKGDSLQRAMDHSCMFNACENGRPLKSQSVSAMNNCKIPNTVHEDIDAWAQVMPGNKMAK